MKKGLKDVLSLSLYLLVVVCLAYLLVTFVVQRTEVLGESMEPTLCDKDNILVDKISYRFHDPKRFDVVVFSVEKQDEESFVKRIIGLPGETVYIDGDGIIYVKAPGEDDFSPLKDFEGLDQIDSNHLGRAAKPITLSKDEYFVLGDNRNNSTDSRSTLTVSKYSSRYLVGNVNKNRIIGKAKYVIYPFDSMRKIK